MKQLSLFLVCFLVLVDKAFGGIPIFSTPTPNQIFPFAEGATGRTVTTVTAADGGSTITYSISSETPTHNPAYFSINSASGILSTATDIDYEAITGPNKATTVVVQALSSAGATDTATVSFTVTITDVNDNTPMFSAVTFCKAILSNSTTGTTVGNYTATDADGTAPHNTITYAIAGGDDTPARFAIDNTGEITTTAEALAVKTYALNITASDGTNTGTALVNVPVDGICDENRGGNGASANKAALSVALIYLVSLLTV